MIILSYSPSLTNTISLANAVCCIKKIAIMKNRAINFLIARFQAAVPVVFFIVRSLAMVRVIECLRVGETGRHGRTRHVGGVAYFGGAPVTTGTSSSSPSSFGVGTRISGQIKGVLLRLMDALPTFSPTQGLPSGKVTL